MYKPVTCRTCGASKIQNIGYARNPRAETGWSSVCKTCTRGTVCNPLSATVFGCTVKQKPEDILAAWTKAMGNKRFEDAKFRKVWRLR